MATAEVMHSPAFVDKGGAGIALPGGARGGAEMRFRGGISVGTQLDGRALPVSPRYCVKSRDIVNGCPGTSFMSGLFSVVVLRVVVFLWVVLVVGLVAGSCGWCRGVGLG